LAAFAAGHSNTKVRQLPVVEEDGRLVDVVAQADIAREAKEKQTGALVERSRSPRAGRRLRP
jgi:CBS-domain-containing membrane protein